MGHFTFKSQKLSVIKYSISVLVISFFTTFQAAGQSTDNKPNVLFIISDDLTATAVSSYENQACHTPNIDKLALQGMRYTHTYCQYPVCGPSRASFMFGYYPSATEAYGYVSGRENVGNERKSWSQYNRQFFLKPSLLFHFFKVKYSF